MWQQSKSGLFHLVADHMNGQNLPKCQSYNLDKPNYLKDNEIEFSQIPEGAKICKKCRGKSSEMPEAITSYNR